MKNIAIVAVAYNRVDSLKRLLTSLERVYFENPQTLIISIDKSNTSVVEEYAEQYNWKYGEKIVDKHTSNLGLRAHMLSLGKWFDHYDAIVVLEDDIVVAPSMMCYVRNCVEKYSDCSEIAGISLYCTPLNSNNRMPFMPIKSEYDVFFMNYAMSWGEVWMKESWLKFYDWYKSHSERFNLPHIPDNVNHWSDKSWLKYHIRYCCEENKYFVFPYMSVSSNYNDAGTHAKFSNNLMQTILSPLVKHTYDLPDFKNCIIKYDTFFEPKFLSVYLGVEEAELTVDLWMKKHNHQRYIVSLKSLPYKVIKSFSLDYKPYELNVMWNNIGNDLFLYDTSVSAKAPKSKNTQKLCQYFFMNALEFVNTNFSVLTLLYGAIKRKANLLKNKWS